MLETSARRLCALALAAAMTLTGCSDEKASAPEPSPTPLASLDTSAMQVPRIEFCELVPGAAVRDALGGKPDSDSAYGNGDEVDLPGEGEEIVHEIGCSWSTDDGASARAWIFARPVDTAFARKAIASSRKAQGCRVSDRPAFGDPSVTQTCRLRDGAPRVRHAGLFGQTWVTCEVTDPTTGTAEVRQRADRWCVAVISGLDTGG